MAYQKYSRRTGVFVLHLESRWIPTCKSELPSLVGGEGNVTWPKTEGDPRRHGGDAKTPMKEVGNETVVVNRHLMILLFVRPACNIVESYGRVNEMVRIP